MKMHAVDIGRTAKSVKDQSLQKNHGIASWLWTTVRREFVMTVVIIITALTLLLMILQVAARLSALQAAPRDNVQWTLAQIDAELLSFEIAVKDVAPNNPESFRQLRQHFSMFNERVLAAGAMPVLGGANFIAPAKMKLAVIKQTLDNIESTINGPDAALLQNIKSIDTQVTALRPVAREITLSGVRDYATEVEHARNEFSKLLGRTALVNGMLILALGTSLLILIYQFRISQRHAKHLQASGERNANTINASLDAIIVMQLSGTIVDFSPAATHTFGYSRNAAIGGNFNELIVPEYACAEVNSVIAKLPHQGSGAGRMQLNLRHANGGEFPAEMSLGSVLGADGPLVIAYIRNITERLSTEQALRGARDEALEGVRAKTQFLAIMSHEMRTPLNGVMALLDLLAASKLSPKQKTYVKTATTSAEILKQHVDDVLDITRIHAGKFELFPQTFDFLELLEEVQNINMAVAKTRGNTITLDALMPEPYFVADRKRLHQVLTNLVGNANKFTEHGNIKIAVQFLEASTNLVTMEVSVSDSGIGIDPAQHRRIFEDFVTLDASYQRNATGTGLGLPISRSIVEAMGGSIGVQSSPGHGSRFWFRIRLKAAFAGTNRILADDQEVEPSLPSRRLHVLLVEDNETNRFVASEMLQAANCKVTTACDGVEGTEAAIKKYFDLILMDISMPRMNGWDAAQKIRSTRHSKSRFSPIYALTAQAQPQEQQALIEAGMQGCVLKPLRARRLAELLKVIHDKMTPEDLTSLNTPEPHYHALAMIDETAVDELRQVFEPAELAHRFGKYYAELSKLGEDLMAKRNAGELDALAKMAHHHAGSAGLFGAAALRIALCELELAARHEDDVDLKGKLAHTLDIAALTAVHIALRAA